MKELTKSDKTVIIRALNKEKKRAFPGEDFHRHYDRIIRKLESK